MLYTFDIDTIVEILFYISHTFQIAIVLTQVN